ncbi:MAG: Hsp70 family protein [Zavarzinella sp.]
MHTSRFIIGIDLGTTNCAVSYLDTGSPEPSVSDLAIPQIVRAGLVDERPLLPSFLYLPGAGEQPEGSMKLQWGANRDWCVGEFARNFGSQVPNRLVASAKSWLCHPGIDHRQAILPWQAPEGNRKISPFEACVRYLRHLADAWNATKAGDNLENRFEEQEVFLTVPASFDPIARELTVQAAKEAGYQHVTLLEEPQAAFYAWLAGNPNWRDQVTPGDLILVVDVGGGTTDLTLIEVTEDAGNLALTRLAVGDHLLLGGDNMDLTLAHHLAQVFASKGHKLDLARTIQLGFSARQAKETLLNHPEQTSAPVTVLGSGRSVIANTLKADLQRDDVLRIILDGFFAQCPLTESPQKSANAGFQELGLPYVSDPAITRHLAEFLTKNRDFLRERDSKETKKVKSLKKSTHALPTKVLFNGGVFKSNPLQERLLTVLNEWAKSEHTETVSSLTGSDLDQAVARGAAYYGLVRRGSGIRIRGGTPRSYYIGIETAMPAVPGFPRPIKALCVAPFGMEEGSQVDIPSQEFGLIVGQQAKFRFLASNLRRNDHPGSIIEDWEADIEELAPVATTLEGAAGQLVPVHLHTKVTETGQMELWCFSRDNQHQWKLEYDVRNKSATT